MTKKEDSADKEVLKWIREYSGWWYLICILNEEHMNMETMKILMERLEKEAFYELVFVLRMAHRHEAFMRNLSESMILDF